MRMGKHVYRKDEVVVGSCLASCLYSLSHNVPLVFIKKKKPFLFDVIDVSGTPWELESGNLVPQVKLWEKLFFYLGLRGLVFGTDLCRNIRLEDNRVLKITTEHSRLAIVEFEKLTVFDPEQIVGLPQATDIEEDKHVVIDWFNIRKGSKHKHNYFTFEGDFLKEVWFYSGDRAPDPSLRDSVVRSYLTSEQLEDFDFSATTARILLEKRLSDRIGRQVLLEHAGRDIQYRKRYFFEKTPSITFVDTQPHDMLHACKPGMIKGGYDTLLSLSRDSSNSL